ncbi:MAG: hypothetical protein V1698_00385 [bacterium]
MEDDIKKLQKIIKDAEKTMNEAQKALQRLSGHSGLSLQGGMGGESLSGEKIIEGRFDGQSMADDTGKIYPVPANYASKSKLVEGDRLKLTVSEDGSFVFKQIGPIDRKRVIGVLKSDITTRGFVVDVDGRIYKVLLASVTYFKAKEKDTVILLVPKIGQSMWGAIENVLGSSAGGAQGGEFYQNNNDFNQNNNNKDGGGAVKSLEEIIGEVASEEINSEGENDFEW